MKKLAALIIILNIPFNLYFFFTNTSNCVLVKYLGMEQIANNIFVSHDLSSERKLQILRTVSSSKDITEKFWGSIVSDPVIIICNTDNEFSSFGEYQSEALTRVYPFGTYIVISPGNLNENILSHELTHSELYQRTGFVNNYKIPEWFHEGLAVLSSENVIDPEAIKYKYDKVTLNGKLNIPLNDFSFNEKYFGYKDKCNIYYTKAEMEVLNWYIKNDGRKGLIEFVDKLNSHSNFYEAFK